MKPYKDVRDLGQQPRSPTMKQMLAEIVGKREPEEIVVIHHYTDRKSGLQLEVERRSETLGIHFERIVFQCS